MNDLNKEIKAAIERSEGVGLSSGVGEVISKELKRAGQMNEKDLETLSMVKDALKGREKDAPPPIQTSAEPFTKEPTNENEAHTG